MKANLQPSLNIGIIVVSAAVAIFLIISSIAILVDNNTRKVIACTQAGMEWIQGNCRKEAK